MVIASELKAGMAIRIEGGIYKVLEVESKAGAAKLSGLVKTKLSNVDSGRLWEPHFRLQERLENVALDRRTMEFLFSDADTCTFMDLESFEQIEVRSALMGIAAKFLQSGMQLPVEFFEGRPVSVVFPDIFEAQVARTAEPIHAQQDSTWKSAILDNGVEIRVPLFIGPGETVRVDLRTGHYVERARRRSA